MASELLFQFAPAITGLNSVLVVEASEQLSAGIPDGQDVDLRLITVLALSPNTPTVQIDLATAYIAAFGALQVGRKIVVEATVIDSTTGIAAPTIRAVTIVTTQSPYTRSDLVAYFDAAVQTTIVHANATTPLVSGRGQNVGRWVAVNNAAIHADQSTTNNRPIWSDISLNGLPGITFNGTTSFLRVAAPAVTAQPLTVYLVGLIPATPSVDSVLWDSTTTTNRARLVATNTGRIQANAGTQLDGGLLPAGPWVLGVAWTDATHCLMTMNGTQIGSGTSNSQGLSTVQLGSSNGAAPGQFTAITMSEWDLFNTAHDLTTQNAIAHQLMGKWNIRG